MKEQNEKPGWTMITRLQQLAEKGLHVEVELRDKEGELPVGKISFVGGDYLEFTREATQEIAVPGSKSDVTSTTVEITTIIALKDIRAISMLTDSLDCQTITKPIDGDKVAD